MLPRFLLFWSTSNPLHNTPHPLHADTTQFMGIVEEVGDDVTTKKR